MFLLFLPPDAVISSDGLSSPGICLHATDDAEEKDYVGFATLPNQVHRKSVKKGFDFTLMVAGESGLGKSTLVNSLFLTDLHKDRKLLNAEERINQTVEITKHTVDIEERGVKLKLTIVDTPGFGDAVNNSECWCAVTDYINQQFENYFRDESGLNRKNIQDNRVHCCLYFIPPFGHGLRPVDIEFMKALQDKVNVVPLIAKADCLTPSEIKKLKERLREEIDKYGIKIYQFPDCDSDEDEEFKRQDKELKESSPFAVIGSNTVVEARGQRVRGRLYPWGIVEGKRRSAARLLLATRPDINQVYLLTYLLTITTIISPLLAVENPSHCDFVKLRTMLIRTHMHDLKDITSDCHYENYRAQCIHTMTSKMNADKRVESPIPILPLPTPDGETEKLIKMKDDELRRMQQMLQKMQQQMHEQDL
ncbi:septin 5b isoform X1 [Centropristis striata]|uniref:septin 5b isoform X1 n=1 Tax=Centropristis striata TaxID=184440 RepID=UPI0027DF9C65|nr:septin 5b isoform X1 [Centropristis striata]